MSPFVESGGCQVMTKVVLSGVCEFTFLTAVDTVFDQNTMGCIIILLLDKQAYLHPWF